MAGIQDFQTYTDDFQGSSVTFPATVNIGTPWVQIVTGAAPPTGTRTAGEAVFTLTSADQAQILGLAHGDALSFDIDNVQSVEYRVKLGAATFASGNILVFGLGSARNNTADTVQESVWFRMEGANSTTLVYVESDDNVRNIDDVSTGVTLGTTYKRFWIDFTGGKSDVKFYIDGERVAASQRFDMSGYSGNLQPIVQLQKASGTSVAVASIDYVNIEMTR